MATETISLEVDPDTARAFSEASSEDRRKLELLLRLRLRELTSRPARPLKEVMDDIGREAEARGPRPDPGNPGVTSRVCRARRFAGR